MDNSREFALRNEQPIDVAETSPQDDVAPDVELGAGNMSRDGRSPVQQQQLQQGYQRDTSLAMRALNANRILQALSSGQPLMSYDKIYSPADRQDNPRQAKLEGDK